MASSERAGKDKQEQRGNDLLSQHKLAMVELYAAINEDSLEYSKRVYDSDKIHDFLSRIRITMSAPYASTENGHMQEQESETQRILRGARIPIILYADPDWLKRRAFEPVVQASFIPAYGSQNLIWIKNSDFPLFSGTVSGDGESGDVTIHHKPSPYRDEEHIVLPQNESASAHAVCITIADDWLSARGFDVLPPKSIRLPGVIEQFIKPDGTLIERWELERLVAARNKRILDLRAYHEPHAVVRYSSLADATDNPHHFLVLVSQYINELRLTWDESPAKPFRRGKIGTQPFYLKVTETPDDWQIRITNIDASDIPLRAIQLPDLDSALGDLVVKIGKNEQLTFDAWVESADQPGIPLRHYNARRIIGATEVMNLLSDMQADIEIPQRVERVIYSNKKKHKRRHV